ncbi:MAG: NADH-quinone oxidoreductase subunit C [Candidatus Thermoplasmatota archaeon]|nr:NADH-quinone oxidoreductase subunit C [Candidatus Thermoplasmatota archaeon]
MNQNLPISVDQIEEHFKEELGDAVSDIKKEEIEKGLKETPIKLIWMKVERDQFRDAVEALSELQVPHLSVASGSDMGDIVELIYHFQVNHGFPADEISVNIKVHLPKDDLKIPTITDIVPGAVTTEREKQEFLGVDVVDIPDSRRLWLDEEFPEDRYPWRWDEKGMEEMARYVHDPEEASAEPTSERVGEKRGGEEG